MVADVVMTTIERMAGAYLIKNSADDKFKK